MKKLTLFLSGLVLASLFNFSFAQGNLSKLINADCGKVDVLPSTTLTAKAKPNATKYEFKVVNNSTSYLETVERNTNTFKLNKLTILPEPNKQYKVKVRTKKNGNWSNWGQVCNIKTQGLKTTQLKQQYCGATNVAATDILKFKKVPFATSYEVVAHINSLGYDTITATTNQFIINDFSKFSHYRHLTFNFKIRPISINLVGIFGLMCSVQMSPLPPVTTCGTNSNCNLIGNESFENVTLKNPNIYPLVAGYQANHGALPACWSGAWGDPEFINQNLPNNTFNLPYPDNNWIARLRASTNWSEGFVQQLNNTNSINNSEVYFLEYNVSTSHESNKPSLGLDNLDDFVVTLTNSTSNLFPFTGLSTPSNISANILALSGQQTIDNTGFLNTQGSWIKRQTCFTSNDDYDQVYFYGIASNNYDWTNIGVDDFKIVKLADAGEDKFCKNSKIGPCEVITPITGTTLSYSWLPTTGLSNPNIANPIANPTIPTTYTLTVTFDDGSGNICSSTDNVFVTFDIITITENGNVCFGNTTDLTLTSTGQIPTNPNDIQWYTSTGINIGFSSTITVSIDGTYTVVYTNANNCQIKEEYTVKPCCFNQNIGFILLNNLNGTYNNTTNQLPTINPGDNVVLDGDVTFENLSLKWEGVNVYAESYYTTPAGGIGNITGSHLILNNCEASFVKCSFQSTCDEMWGGITIQGETKFNIEKSSLTDAFESIKLESYNSDNYIIGNNFFNNYYSIVLDYKNDFSSSTITGSEIVGNNFNSDGKLKTPFDNHFSQAHLYHEKSALYSINGLKLKFKYSKNKHYNSAFGITSTYNTSVGMQLDNCLFENCFIGAIYDNADKYHFNNEINAQDCIFNFPQSIPAQYASYGNHSYGIRCDYNYIYSFRNTFNSSNDPLNYTLQDIGIASEYLANINIDECYFYNLDNAIKLKVFGGTYLQHGISTSLVYNGWTGELLGTSSETCQYNREVTSEVVITSNFFVNNKRSIHYLNNSNWINLITAAHDNYDPLLYDCNDGDPIVQTPQAVTSLINQVIHCNDFIKKTPASAPQQTAIYLEPNAMMADIGDCLNKPGANDIIDQSLSMFSIYNLGVPFNYNRYANENDFANYIPPTQNFNSIGSNFICNFTPIADNSTCPNTSAGILERIANGRTKNIGYEPDNRYKSKNWFKDSNLGNAQPNPSTNHVIIPVELSKESEDAEIIVYSSIGLKANIAVSITESGSVNLNISKLKTGMYFYSLIINNTTVDTKKLIKVK